jgi:hypothetical protein
MCCSDRRATVGSFWERLPVLQAAIVASLEPS